MVINIQTEIDNRHPDDSLNVLNISTENSSSVIVTSPPTNHHHNEYEKLPFTQLDVTTHQTETVISNSHNSSLNSYIEKMSTDIKLNSMSTKQYASNDLKRDIPPLTHKQLINAYIEKKAGEILIPFTNKVETLIKSYEVLANKNAFLESKNKDLELSNTKSSEIHINGRDE